MKEDLLQLLISLTKEDYTLSITPGIQGNYIQFKLDNCVKVHEYDKMIRCCRVIEKEHLDYETTIYIIKRLLDQLKDKEKENDQT